METFRCLRVDIRSLSLRCENLESAVVGVGNIQFLSLDNNVGNPLFIHHGEKFGIADLGFGNMLLVKNMLTSITTIKIITIHKDRFL